MKGKYLEVERPYKLKYTCAMPDFSPVIDTISVDIRTNENGGSQLRFIQVGEGIHEELEKLPEGTISNTEKGSGCYGVRFLSRSSC